MENLSTIEILGIDRIRKSLGHCDSCLCAHTLLCATLIAQSWNGLDKEEGRNSFAGRRTATIEPRILQHPATRGIGVLETRVWACCPAGAARRRARCQPYIINCRNAPLKSTAFSNTISAQ